MRTILGGFSIAGGFASLALLAGILGMTSPGAALANWQERQACLEKGCIWDPENGGCFCGRQDDH
jgi:hypothetical protein